jgi:adenosylcobinamide-GDP ribazoletransferase
VAVAYVAAGALLGRCVQRLGGVTGDVLGGCVEVAVAGALLATA